MSAQQAAPLRWWSIWGYGVGDIANNFVFAMGTFFLLSYYTDVAGLPLLAAGSLLTAVKAYAACVDLVAGRVVDRCATRWGKFRPVILFGGVPLLLLNVLVFSVPTALSPSGKIMYAGVTYALLMTVYSFVNMAYGALASAMTQDSADRARLGAARTFMSVATGSVLTILIGPALASLQGGVLQGRLSFLTVSEALLGVALFGLCFMTTSERVPRRVPVPDLRGSLHAVRTNKPLLVLCGVMVLALLGYTCSGASLVYFARHVSPDPKQFFLLIGLLGLASAALAVALVPRLVRWIGKKHVMLLGLGLCVLGYLLLYLSVRVRTELLMITAFVCTSLGVRVAMSTVWALEADTVEYGEWRTGVRAEGLTYATFSLSRKLGQALGVGCPALLLAWGGYQSGALHQSGMAIEAIAQAVALLPALAVLGACLLMWFYPLTEQLFSEILAEVRARPGAGDSVAASPASDSPPLAMCASARST